MLDRIQMSHEDKARFRMSEARLEAIRLAPGHYSRMEIEEAFIANWKLMEEFVSTYQIDDCRNWQATAVTGSVFVGGAYEL